MGLALHAISCALSDFLCCMQIHLGLASTQVGNLAYWVMWATGHNKVTPPHLASSDRLCSKCLFFFFPLCQLPYMPVKPTLLPPADRHRAAHA